jgi:Phage portal protein, SPP1 Gp6-like
MGGKHPGRVRILPLNPSFAFPEWHPHDRNRLIRFKLKYRFWGTSLDGTRSVFTYTELITDYVIEEYINDELIDSHRNPLGEIPIVHIPNMIVGSSPWGMPDIPGDFLTLNRQYNETSTALADIINYHCVDPETEILTQRGWLKWNEVNTEDEALCLDPKTDEISWGSVQDVNIFPYDGPLIKWDNHIDAVTTPNHRWLAERRYGRAQAYPLHRRCETRTSEIGNLPAGSRLIVGGGIPLQFPEEAKWSDELVETVGWWITEGCYGLQGTSVRDVSTISQSGTHNLPYVNRICRLQRYWNNHGLTFTLQKIVNGKCQWYLGVELTELLHSVAPKKSLTPEFLCTLTFRQAELLRDTLLAADGTGAYSKVGWGEDPSEACWYQDDLRRRDGFQMLMAMLGGVRTRSFENNRGDGVVDVYAKTRIQKKETSERSYEVENKAGFVWCPTVPTGFFFARRHGNTYWTGNSAPTTIVVGAKSSQLEAGAKKVWSGLPKEAQVYNLEMASDAVLVREFLVTLKQAMHEMTGIPITALGQEQPVSNTSGVALQIQYQPMMMRFEQKTTNYGIGFEKINYFALKTLAMKEPELFAYNPETSPPIKDGQWPILDLNSDITYRTHSRFQSPLPIDKLIKINELMSLMQLGLESKRGALKELGHENPDEKLAELLDELIDDAKDQGGLDLLKAQIMDVIMLNTFSGAAQMQQGTAGASGGNDVASAGGPNVDTATGGGNDPAAAPAPVLPGVSVNAANEQDLLEQMSTLASGTKLPQTRTPGQDDDDDD